MFLLQQCLPENWTDSLKGLNKSKANCWTVPELAPQPEPHPESVALECSWWKELLQIPGRTSAGPRLLLIQTQNQGFSRIYGHPGAHQCLAWQWKKMRHKKIWNGSTYLFFFLDEMSCVTFKHAQMFHWKIGLMVAVGSSFIQAPSVSCWCQGGIFHSYNFFLTRSP